MTRKDATNKEKRNKLYKNNNVCVRLVQLVTRFQTVNKKRRVTEG